jgi:hypothetical protein
VLVHDFPHLETSDDVAPAAHPKKWSVTLNGKAEVIFGG